MSLSDQDGDHLPMFARSAESDAFGKLDDDLPPIRIDAETRLRLVAIASEVGMNLSEFLRTTMRVRAWGVEHVASVQAAKLLRAMGNASQSGGNAS